MKKAVKISDSALQFFISRGIISLSDLIPPKSRTMEEIMQTVLDNVHESKINYNEREKRWFTRIPDPTKARGTRMIKKATKEELFSFLVDFYGVRENNSINHNRTLNDLYEEWIEYKALFVQAKSKPLSPTTIAKIKTWYRLHLSFIGDTPLTELKPVSLQKKLIEMIQQNRGPSAVGAMKRQYFECVYCYLGQMLDYAVGQEYIEFSPLSKIKREAVTAFCEADPVKSKPTEERVLTRDELILLLDAIRAYQKGKPHIITAYVVEMIILTDMRRAEPVALHWSDIRNGLIHVDNAESPGHFQ